MKTPGHLPTFRAPMPSQRGVVLLFSLIALVVMLIAAVALVRSFQSSLFLAGNIGFKRDLQNQGERAVDRALTAFRASGALDSPTARAANLKASNYSASILATNAQGIPDVLQSDSTFAAVGLPANDITPANEPSLAAQGVTIRYVIDRLCATAGSESALGPASCVVAENPTPSGGSSANLMGAERAPLCATCASAAPVGVVYRLSVRVAGPRNTQSFFQSTFTVPSAL